MKWIVLLCYVLLVKGALEGEIYRSIILPCSFHYGEGVVIHWTTEDNDKLPVHSYYDGGDRLTDQDKNYKGRTSLFLEEIKNGNASLKLTNLQISDERTYSCYVGTITGSKTDKPIQLKVQVTIWGEQHQNVTMPCSFTPGEDVAIYWKTHNGGSQDVHSYYEGGNQLDNQDTAYKGRSSLFITELIKGNASLQLRNVHKSDENTYSCYAATKTGNQNHKVKLRVADFGHTIEYTPKNLTLTCCVRKVYPSDAVTFEWSMGKKRTEGQSTSNTCQSYMIKNTSQTYECIIKHAIVDNAWRSTWEMKAAAADTVTCACGSCTAENQEFSSKLYFINNTVEVPVASMDGVNTSGLGIAEGYRSRVHNIPGGYGLQLTNLTMEDNGEYICVIETVRERSITVTTVNITDSRWVRMPSWNCTRKGKLPKQKY